MDRKAIRGRKMVTAMKRFLRVLGKVALWGLCGLIGYLIFTNVEKETALWIGVVVVVFAVNYEIQVIKEKLDTIQWTLDDLRRESE